MFGAVYISFLLLEAVKGFKPIISGIALFPETFTVAPSGVIVGLLISRTGQYSATVDDFAITVATSTCLQGFGQSIGAAIGGVIFQNRMKSNLLHYPVLRSLANKYSGEAASAVELIRGMHGRVKEDLKQAYADS